MREYRWREDLAEDMEFDAELMCYITIVIFLVVLSIQDILKGSVNAMTMSAFILVGLLLGFLVLKVSWKDMCVALVPGVCLLLASYIFGNSIGTGDACALMLVGTMNGIRETFTIFCTALALSLIPAAFLYIKGKNGRKTIPFLPFLCAGTVIVLIGKVR